MKRSADIGLFTKPSNYEMKKILIKTLGCKVNQCESEAIQTALLESKKGEIANENDEADVVIVNTCTVTRKAAMQSRQVIRQVIRNHSKARVVVTGCHAQTASEEIAAIKGVDLVVANVDKHRIPQTILALLDQDFAPPVPVTPSAVKDSRRFEPMPSIAHGGRTRPFLKIQDGCDAFCTYCIVPYARGRSRSLPEKQVLAQIAQLGVRGYREVVLTGIHIGCYGQDLTPATNLYDLLCRIREAGSVDRIRVSSIEPGELSKDIIGLADANGDVPGRLCPHFHIPLQSGDDTVLKRMHRPYDRTYFYSLVQTIAHRLPDAAIGVDTLIGFPGETDEAFVQTYELIRSLPVAYLHVFPFSAREGTPAFSFSDQLPPPVIKDRCQHMRRLGTEKRKRFYEDRVGSSVKVLVETTRVRPSGCLKGLTENYIPVHFHGDDELCNSFQSVRIERLSRGVVPWGKLV